MAQLDIPTFEEGIRVLETRIAIARGMHALDIKRAHNAPTQMGKAYFLNRAAVQRRHIVNRKDLIAHIEKWRNENVA